MRYVALLRGINVGKAKRIAMADLRSLLEDLGHADVATVLTSGNAMFTSGSRSPSELAPGIEEAIRERFAIDVKVFVRTLDAVREVVDAVPWPDEGRRDPSRLAISFVDGVVDEQVLAPVLSQDWSPEAIAIGPGVLYLWQPNGMTGSPLGEALGKVKGVPIGTVRNLATVRKVLDRA